VHTRFSGGRRRGATLIELIVASGVTVIVLFSLAGFSRFQAVAWQNVNGDYATVDTAKLALQKLGPSIRQARRVVMASSTASQITLQMPAYDGSGNLVVPMQDGQLLSYYLSDGSGSPSQPGSILWKSVNGVADRTWSMRGNTGRYVLSTGGLTFTYAPAAAPTSVIVSVAAVASGRSFSSSQAFPVRNQGL